jgi:hypothetical protein
LSSGTKSLYSSTQIGEKAPPLLLVVKVDAKLSCNTRNDI